MHTHRDTRVNFRVFLRKLKLTVKLLRSPLPDKSPIPKAGQDRWASGGRTPWWLLELPAPVVLAWLLPAKGLPCPFSTNTIPFLGCFLL